MQPYFEYDFKNFFSEIWWIIRENKLDSLLIVNNFSLKFIKIVNDLFIDGWKINLVR